MERANRTYHSEFYDCYDGTLETNALRSELHGFQHIYNHVRPHQTPVAVLAASGYV